MGGVWIIAFKKQSSGSNITWETVAVCAALLHVAAHLDAAVDVVHGVQHFAVREQKKTGK